MPKSAKRICLGCKKSKFLDAFQKNSSVIGGRRSRCKECMGVVPREVEPPITRFTRPLDSKVYIITSAQNATPVDENFWSCLKVMAKHRGAELVVIPFRYKNPTSTWSSVAQSNDWWGISPYSERVLKEENPFAGHLHNTRKKLCDNLILAADIKTQPTASAPLSGFESLTGAESCIIGHPKMSLKVVAVPSGQFPKILTTTGACTKKNYTDSKAGKVGAFHHFLGAIIVEIEGKEFHLRQLNANREDGSFTDLDTHYTSKGVTKAPPAKGLVMGDTHARFMDPDVDQTTFGPGGIVEILQPETLVWHDTLDGYANNPHHFGNPFISQAKYQAQLGNVREEVQHAVRFVSLRTKGRKSVIVASNHDDFLKRWVIAHDWKRDPGNAEFYLETALCVLKSARVTKHGAEYADPFRYWVETLAPKENIRCLAPHESFRLGKHECSLHGHQGPNGSRGTTKNLSRLGVSVIKGHEHTPGIEEGCYGVGTSTPRRLEYTEGPSSWLNTHCIVYATGARALITIIRKNWRGK